MIQNARIKKEPKTYLLLTLDEIKTLQTIVDFYGDNNITNEITKKLDNAQLVLEKPLTL